MKKRRKSIDLKAQSRVERCAKSKAGLVLGARSAPSLTLASLRRGAPPAPESVARYARSLAGLCPAPRQTRVRRLPAAANAPALGPRSRWGGATPRPFGRGPLPPPPGRPPVAPAPGPCPASPFPATRGPSLLPRPVPGAPSGARCCAGAAGPVGSGRRGPGGSAPAPRRPPLGLRPRPRYASPRLSGGGSRAPYVAVTCSPVNRRLRAYGATSATGA